MIQVLGLFDLACRMPLDRKLRVLNRHPGTIVRHPDQALAAMLRNDLDLIGAGIQRILDKFFDDRRRPLDHFPGRDLIGHKF